MGFIPTEKSAIKTERLTRLSLDEMNAFASLQTRTDRKYIIQNTTCNRLIKEVDIQGGVLDLNGKRSTMYQSIYFDTPDLDIYKDAAYRRRPRFKARTRLYQNTNTAMLEVKTKDGRGKTVKKRTPYEVKNTNHLTNNAKAFIDGVVGISGASHNLQATLTSQYQRTTIVDQLTKTRMTCDEFLVCTDWENRSVTLPMCILETKSSGQPSPFDKWLWENKKRPISISKYCTTLAVLHPDLPANKWHQTIKTFF